LVVERAGGCGEGGRGRNRRGTGRGRGRGRGRREHAEVIPILDDDHEHAIIPLEAEFDVLALGDFVHLAGAILASEPLPEGLLTTPVPLGRLGRLEVIAAAFKEPVLVRAF